MQATSSLLLPLSAVAAKILAEEFDGLKQYVQTVRENINERTSRSERNRRLIMDLVGAGIEVWVNEYTKTGEYFRVILGGPHKSPRAQAKLQAKLVTVATILGGSLGKPATDIHNARRREITIEFRPDKVPGCTVTYVEKLPKGAHCKIVRERQSRTVARLECGVGG